MLQTTSLQLLSRNGASSECSIVTNYLLLQQQQHQQHFISTKCWNMYNVFVNLCYNFRWKISHVNPNSILWRRRHPNSEQSDVNNKKSNKTAAGNPTSWMGEMEKFTLNTSRICFSIYIQIVYTHLLSLQFKFHSIVTQKRLVREHWSFPGELFAVRLYLCSLFEIVCVEHSK